MYYLEDQAIDFEQECQAIADHLQTHWESEAPWLEVAQATLAHARHDARAWYDKYRATAFISALLTRRAEVLTRTLGKREAEVAGGYDAIALALFEMSCFERPLHEACQGIDGKWDFERRASAATRALVARLPGLAAARPKGWQALREGYRDFDGQREYSSEQHCLDAESFQGANTEGAGSADFVSRVALPHVMYDDVCQGRGPVYTVIAAIYGHFLRLVEHQNTVEGLHDMAPLTELVACEGMQLTLPSIQLESAHPFVLAAWHHASEQVQAQAHSQSQYEQALEAAVRWDALSQEEQKARREAIADELISEVLAEEKSRGDAPEPALVRARDLVLAFTTAQEPRARESVRPRS